MAVFAALALGSSARAASLQLDKSPIVLGQTESVAVDIRIDEPSGADVRPLRLAVNVGSFSPVQRMGTGRYRAVYTPPSTKFPQVALVAVWRETGAEAPIEFLRIPLSGSTTLPVGAKRNSKITVVVGEDTFGPIKVDEKQEDVPIIVPPGVREAELRVREANGNALTKKLPVDVPPYNRLTAALVPHAIMANGNDQARLDVFYDRADASLKASRIKVTASVGSVTFERSNEGRFTYWYRAPAGTPANAVEFTVTVEGDTRSRAQTRLALGLPPPGRVVVRPPARVLHADGVSKESVSVIVLDNEGLGLPDQQVTLAANGVALPALKHLGSGVYETTYVAPSSFPSGGLVQFTANVTSGAATLEGLANYLVSPTALPKEASYRLQPNPVPADGRSGAELYLDVRDEAGLPLQGAKLVAVASHGTLGPLEDDGGGRYHARYTAPTDIPQGETLVRLVDASGAFEQRIPLPMREDPRRLLIGVRGAFAHSLGDLLGPRGGVDVTAPLRAGPLLLWVSLLAQVGAASQSISDSSGRLTTRSELLFVPLAARVAVELFARRRLAVHLGAGGGATWARYSTTLTGEQTTAWGPSAQGFVGVTAAVGPGHFFFEGGYTWAPVSSTGFRVETGGLVLALGYRLGVL